MAAQPIRVAVEGLHSARKEEVQNLLAAAGLKSVVCKGIAAVYRLDGDLTISDAESVAKELLCDPVVERFAVNSQPPNKSIYFVDVWYKPGVTDAAGDSVLKAISDLKIDRVKKVFSGTRYEFFSKGESKSTEKAVREFSNRELLNPLVQECKILKL